MFPLGSRLLSRFAIGFFFVSSANLAFAQAVHFAASWKTGKENWLVHFQPPGGILIAPNSPAFENDSLIQVSDAASKQPVQFKLHRPQDGVIRGFDIAFPQLRRPINLLVTIRGLSLVDQKGHRVAYTETVTVRAPMTAEATPRPSTTPAPGRKYYSFSGGPPGGAPTGQGAPPPEYLEQPVGGAAPPEPSPPRPREPQPGVRPPAGDGQIPQFPFPPPLASAFETIPRELLVADKTQPKLKDVDKSLSDAFRKCGYGEKKFYAVPDGFAMSSRIEQMSPDGSIGANRWSLQIPPITNFSIESYLRALFRARAGHYRIVVF